MLNKVITWAGIAAIGMLFLLIILARLAPESYVTSVLTTPIIWQASIGHIVFYGGLAVVVLSLILKGMGFGRTQGAR